MNDADKQLTNSKRVIGRPFPKGVSGNLKGRPKGQSLKEYDREKFAKMTFEEKEHFLKTIMPEMRYRMAEGNPHQSGDAKIELEVKPFDDA